MPEFLPVPVTSGMPSAPHATKWQGIFRFVISNTKHDLASVQNRPRPFPQQPCNSLVKQEAVRWTRAGGWHWAATTDS